MKKILIILFLFFMVSCSSGYEYLYVKFYPYQITKKEIKGKDFYYIKYKSKEFNDTYSIKISEHEYNELTFFGMKNIMNHNVVISYKIPIMY